MIENLYTRRTSRKTRQPRILVAKRRFLDVERDNGFTSPHMEPPKIVFEVGTGFPIWNSKEGKLDDESFMAEARRALPRVNHWVKDDLLAELAY